MVFGSVRPVHEWTTKGRLFYSKQWALLRGSEEGAATVEAGFDAIRPCVNSSWSEWLEGSAPLFWNWPQEYQKDMRDGQPHFLAGSSRPPYLRPQSKHKDPAKQELMWAKVVKVRRLGTSRPEQSRVRRASSVWTRGLRTSGWSTTGHVADSTTFSTPPTLDCRPFVQP